MKPALTPEEWANAMKGEPINRSTDLTLDSKGWLDVGYGSPMAGVPPEEHHAAAALCLHSQPFGFTREDTKLLEDIARQRASADHPDVAEALESLSARIAALLPTEGT